MANFSSNEIRHFYVVTELTDDNTPLGYERDASNQIIPSSTPVKDGALALRWNGADPVLPDGDIWFEYKSPNGGVAGTGGIVRTDIIEQGKLTYAKASGGKETPFPKKRIILDPALNSGTPIAGQKYIFRVRFYGMGVGNNDIQYSKSSGVYTAKPGERAATVLTALADMFIKGYKNEPEQWVTVHVANKADTGAANLDDAAIFVEAANTGAGSVSASLRPYSRGRKTGEPMRFELNINTVSYNNQDYSWGEVEDVTADNDNKYTNSRVVSDMEYFYLGERTAQDRTWSYPFNFDMVYVSTPDPTINYNFLDLGFFYSGDAEDVQRSKKQMTFAFNNDDYIVSIIDGLANKLGNVVA